MELLTDTDGGEKSDRGVWRRTRREHRLQRVVRKRHGDDSLRCGTDDDQIYLKSETTCDALEQKH